jgi:hypothetical protein
VPRIGNKFARELRDQRMIELYAAGTSLANLAKEFHLTEKAACEALTRHPSDLERATKKIHDLRAATYRRGAALLRNNILIRAENMEEDEAKKMRASDAEKWSVVMSDFEKQAQLAEGLATERTEAAHTVNITVKNQDTAKAIANGISGGAIQL